MKSLTLIAAGFVAVAVFSLTFGGVWSDGIYRASLVSTLGSLISFGITVRMVRIFTD